MTGYDRIGHYRVVRLLGAGGMGAVYEAMEDRIGRRVAIKVLHADVSAERDSRLRFINEARVVNRVRHPSLITVHEMGELPDGSAYIVMEFLEGETLTHRMQRRGDQSITLPEILRFMRQVTSALGAVHAQGIVHRDLKPDNLMLVADPEVQGGERVKILDFGIAKVREPNEGGARMTATGMGMGTPEYMPPEQVYGANKVDGSADIYSLGVILFELLSGRLPFEGDQRQVLGGHLFRPPPDVRQLAPAVPESLAQLVARMLAKEPGERPHVVELQRELRTIPTTLGGELPAISRVVSAMTYRLYGRRRLVAVLAVLLTVGAAGWLLSKRPGRNLPSAVLPMPPVSGPSISAARSNVSTTVNPPVPMPSAASPPSVPVVVGSPEKGKRPLGREVSAGTTPSRTTQRRSGANLGSTAERPKVSPPPKKGLHDARIPLLD